MNKDDAKAVMKSKHFEKFINKTSKVMERALTNAEYDIMGSFFEDSDKNSTKITEGNRGDKVTSMFTF